MFIIDWLIIIGASLMVSIIITGFLFWIKEEISNYRFRKDIENSGYMGKRK